MNVKDLMSDQVISVSPEESVAVAARLMTRHNVGALPVRDRDGSLCGILTDRDVVTRCVALERPMQQTSVARVMTSRVATVPPTASVDQAAAMLAKLSDLSRQAPAEETADVLREVTANIKHL